MCYPFPLVCTPRDAPDRPRLRAEIGHRSRVPTRSGHHPPAPIRLPLLTSRHRPSTHLGIRTPRVTVPGSRHPVDCHRPSPAVRQRTRSYPPCNPSTDRPYRAISFVIVGLTVVVSRYECRDGDSGREVAVPSMRCRPTRSLHFRSRVRRRGKIRRLISYSRLPSASLARTDGSLHDRRWGDRSCKRGSAAVLGCGRRVHARLTRARHSPRVSPQHGSVPHSSQPPTRVRPGRGFPGRDRSTSSDRFEPERSPGDSQHASIEAGAGRDEAALACTGTHDRAQSDRQDPPCWGGGKGNPSGTVLTRPTSSRDGPTASSVPVGTGRKELFRFSPKGRRTGELPHPFDFLLRDQVRHTKLRWTSILNVIVSLVEWQHREWTA